MWRPTSSIHRSSRGLLHSGLSGIETAKRWVDIVCIFFARGSQRTGGCNGCGRGTPAVVSYPLQDRIAEFARVCSYDASSEFSSAREP
jgi:hypothetical protein